MSNNTYRGRTITVLFDGTRNLIGGRRETRRGIGGKKKKNEKKEKKKRQKEKRSK